jgi:hypothetical protein
MSGHGWAQTEPWRSSSGAASSPQISYDDSSYDYDYGYYDDSDY